MTGSQATRHTYRVVILVRRDGRDAIMEHTTTASTWEAAKSIAWARLSERPGSLCVHTLFVDEITDQGPVKRYGYDGRER